MQSLALLLIIFTLGTSTQHIHYVKPNDFSSQDCLVIEQPCLTLDQYTQQIEKYFTTGATFLFLAGNHSLNTTVILTNVSDITFRGNGYNSDANVILCNNDVSILCENVTNFKIETLTFILHSNSSNYQVLYSALKVFNSREITLFNTVFHQRSEDLNEHLMRAILSTHSDLVITSCRFEGNTGEYGGVILASGGSNITLNGNVFIGNKAMVSGGAIFANESSLLFIETLGNTFTRNSAVHGGAVYSLDSKMVIAKKEMDPVTLKSHEEMVSADSEARFKLCTNFSKQYSGPRPHTLCFSNNKAHGGGGAIRFVNSTALLNGTVVIFVNNSAEFGGAIYSLESLVTSNTEHLYFTGNRALDSGGAIAGSDSSLYLGENENNTNHFSDNSANIISGGAIHYQDGILKIAGNSHFTGNCVEYQGGAISVFNCFFILSGRALFTGNHAGNGGAISFSFYSYAIFNGTVIEFVNNSANNGGGIYSYISGLVTITKQIKFIANSALEDGGGIWCSDSTEFRMVSANFINNTAGKGGAILVYKDEVTYHDLVVTGNSGSALYILRSNVTLSGITRINKNTGKFGGGIQGSISFIFLKKLTVFEKNEALEGGGGAISASYETTLSFSGVTIFTNNKADDGGAISGMERTIILIDGNTTFQENTADTKGGAIYASNTHISLKNEINFSFNSAQNGGGMYFENGATITLQQHTTLFTSYNHASEYGGAIYHEDSVTLTQCNFEMSDITSKFHLPYCFIDIKAIKLVYITHSIHSLNDSAGSDGSFLYGGLLDKCQRAATGDIGNINPFWSVLYPILMSRNILDIKSKNDNNIETITSKVYKLCFCKKDHEYSCSQVTSIETYRGQIFSVSLLAFAQGNTITSTVVTAKLSPTARLKLNQSSQSLSRNCTNISYNLYSTNEYEKLVLYPDGPCRDTGLARAVIKVTLLPCPDAFTQSGDQCVCEERLQAHNAECTISDEEIYIIRKADSRLWVSALYLNETYQGLILYQTCPVEYCKTETVLITLSQPDIQCNLNRSGVLCGSCAINQSLLFGGSKCQMCANTYLALLLPFAAAGIALVVFLSFLRLTVATGMINSVILYANIVQANRNLFFPSSSNILTIFIAWMNLDLGFQTCFYDGMDAYAQTWLQFVFPVYVWILISLIILTSRYSSTVTKLIGSNPIAVLATLLLMSYTKILKITIEVYSSLKLAYPDNMTVTVWLKDANVPYLQSKHLLLTVVTSLVSIFLFLPYTLLLLLGHKLYRFSGRKYFLWLNRIKPLLDSYYAPYKRHTCYWTGFMLLVRCALYIIFSYNSLGGTGRSLLTIIITFTAIGIVSGYLASGRIYNNFYVNIIEASIYLNLVILSAAAATHVNTPALVFALVGIVFATIMAIIVYHFHLLYTAKSSAWLKIKAQLSSIIETSRSLTITDSEVPPLFTPHDTSSHDPHKIVSKTIIDLREPLLDN